MRIIDRVLISIYNFFHHQCEGCIARAYEIARLNHANEEMRHQLNEVIDNQKVMLRDILKLNQPNKQTIFAAPNLLFHRFGQGSMSLQKETTVKHPRGKRQSSHTSDDLDSCEEPPKKEKK